MEPREVAEIAAEAYRAKGFQVSQIRAGGGRFASFDVKAPDGSTFTIQMEDSW